MKRLAAGFIMLVCGLALLAGCGGSSSDNPPPEDTVISYAYLQHRTYPNSDFNHLRAWVEITSNGNAITAGDVSVGGVTLLDPSGTALVPDVAPIFYDNSILTATWDEGAGAFGATSVMAWGGFTLDLSNYATLPEGDYTFEVDIGTDAPLTYTFYYPGMATAALVDINTLGLVDLDTSATFTWTEPTGNLDLYVFKLINQDDRTIFYGIVPAGVGSVIFTSPMIDELVVFDPTITTLDVQIEGRLYTLDEMNYARSTSGFFSIPLE